MNYNDFFSLNASELQMDNPWSSEYLNSPDSDVNNGLNSESILILSTYKDFFNIADRSLFFDYFSKEIYPPNNEMPAVFKEFEKYAVEREIADLNANFDFIKSEASELYAAYESTDRDIVYYQKFYEAPNEIKQIVTIHERMHAFHHLHWSAFPNASIVYKEFLAQLFTFMAVRNTYLQRYFEDLSEIQPDIYRTWKPYDFGFENEDVFKVFEDIKNGSLDNAFLNKLAIEYP